MKIVNKKSIQLKILGTGIVKQKINIEADFFSKSAKDKLEYVTVKMQRSAILITLVILKFIF